VAAGERPGAIAESGEQGHCIAEAGWTMIGERTRYHGNVPPRLALSLTTVLVPEEEQDADECDA
jgi:hypothetical protein